MHYITDYCKLCQHFHYFEPNSNILSSLCHSPSGFTDKFLSIKSDLNPIVKQGKKGSQRKSCHKNGNKSKLKH